jgi:putative methyltransferase (TIGR04325 family)
VIARLRVRLSSRSKGSASEPEPEQVFPSHSAALADCGLGYDDSAIAQLVAEKTRRYAAALEAGVATVDPTGVAVAFAVRDASTVLDFGGATGAHYEIARYVLGRDFRWTVVETPAMIAAATPTDRLRFQSEIAGSPDAVISSGTLMFVPDPDASLNQLLALKARHVLLARLLFGEPRIVIHRARLSDHGYGPMPEGWPDHETSTPMAWLDREHVEGEVAAAGYTVTRLTDGLYARL